MRVDLSTGLVRGCGSVAAAEVVALVAHMRGGDDQVLGTEGDDLIDGGPGHDSADGLGGMDECPGVETAVNCE